MSRNKGFSRAPGAALRDRFDQKQSAADHRAELARKIAERLAEKARQATPPVRISRPSSSFVGALRSLKLHKVGIDAPLGLTEEYLQLVDAICETTTAGGRQTLLFWPAGGISATAAAALTCVADCLAATHITVRHGGEDLPAASPPLGLRTVVFPFARTSRSPLREVYVDKATLAACHIRHATRALEPGQDSALADYHTALSRVKTLSGRARDGHVYDEFKHPNLDEIVPIGPGHGAMPANGRLLWHALEKTDLKIISRSGDADLGANAKFFVFALRAGDSPAQHIRGMETPPDLLLLDLTRTGRNRLGLRWRATARATLEDFEKAFPGIGVVALTDDPWTFDATRFEVLGTARKEKQKTSITPSSSRVLFARQNQIAGEGTPADIEWRGADNIVFEGFGGPLQLQIEALRALANTAAAAGDEGSEATLRKVIGRIRGAASLPASLSALTSFVSTEMGDTVAAEQLAVYEIGQALSDLAAPGSVLTQVAPEALRAASAGALAARQQSTKATPMALLLSDVIQRQLRASSKCLVVFRSDLLAELAYAELVKEHPSLAGRIDRGMIRFTDSAGADDLAQLPPDERSHITKLILVAPTRTAVLAAMAQPWLPNDVVILADVDTVRSVARDARRLAGYPQLAPLHPRLRALGGKAEECANRLGTSKIALDGLDAPGEDVEFPAGTIVDLAGPGKGDRELVEITLEGGQRIVARKRTRLVARDRERSIPTYGEVDADSVSRGDEIVVMGQAFIERMRPLLNITAVAAEEIRSYHDLVAKRFAAMPGESTAVRLRAVVAAMGEPAVPAERVRYWVNLAEEAGKDLQDVIPHAPQDFPTFRRFMVSALGVSASTAERYWAWAVIAQRSVRLKLGLALYDAYRGILVNPYAAQTANFDRRAEVKSVLAAAESFVALVQSTRNFRG